MALSQIYKYIILYGRSEKKHVQEHEIKRLVILLKNFNVNSQIYEKRNQKKDSSF